MAPLGTTPAAPPSPSDPIAETASTKLLVSRTMANGCMEKGVEGTIDTTGTSSSSSNSNSAFYCSKEDAELMRQAELAFAEQRHFKSASYLRAVSEQRLLTAEHQRILEMAVQAEQVKKELLQPNPETKGWTKQGENHGNHDICVYYKVLAHKAIISRVEIPIEMNLLVPLLAVLNESSLYHTWMPSWKHPKLGISDSTCLREIARGHQIMRIVMDLPFPFANREIIQHAFAVDSVDEDFSVVMKIVTLGEGVTEGVTIGKTPKHFRRVDMDAGILIRPCPQDHPSVRSSSSPDDNNKNEPLFLFTLMQQMDFHIAGVPMAFINFFTRTALGQQWAEMLRVAEDVRDGKRPAHQKLIAEKAELYGWVQHRFEKLTSALQLQQPTLE